MLKWVYEINPDISVAPAFVRSMEFIAVVTSVINQILYLSVTVSGPLIL